MIVSLDLVRDPDHDVFAYYPDIDPGCYRPGWVGLRVGPVSAVLCHHAVEDLMVQLLLATSSSINRDNADVAEDGRYVLDPATVPFIVTFMEAKKPLFELVDERVK